MKNAKILVIDDDPLICEVVAQILTLSGYDVSSATCGEEGLRRLYKVHPDLVLLDIMMPEMDGLEVLKRIRCLTDIPVIMLSALSQTDITVSALEIGADDFIKKPFKREELLARIRALLRRAIKSASVQWPCQYQDGYLAIDIGERRVWVEGKPVRLTVTEYNFFEYLWLHCGRVCTYTQILENIWQSSATNRLQYIHVYVWRLRNKIEQDPNNPKYLFTVHGVGYRFEKQA